MDGKLFKGLEFKAIGNIIEKSSDDTGRRIIRGYASVSDVLDRQNEIITREALVKAKDDLLKNPTIFYEHKHDQLPVGKTIATEVDDRGLLITVEFTKAEFASDLWNLIKEGIINRFSIGGRVLEAQEKRDKEGNLFNEIQELELFETSIVGLPANPEARFELVSKSFNKAITEEMEKKGGRKEMAKEKTEKKIVSRQELQSQSKKEEKKEDAVNVDNVTSSSDTSNTTVNVVVDNSADSAETVVVDNTTNETEETKLEEVSKPKKKKTKVKKSEESEKVEETVEDKEEVEAAKSEEVEEVVEDIKEELFEENDEIEKDHTNNATSEENLHWHEVAVDENGDGETTTIITKEGYMGDANHVHPVVDGEVQTSDDHQHELLADPSVEASTENSDEKAIEETEEDETEKTKSEETSLEEDSIKENVEEPEELEEEKNIDEKILDVLNSLVQLMSNKKEEEITEKADEVEESVAEETSNTQEAIEEVETTKEDKEEEVLEPAVAKSEETEIQKTVEPEVEKKQLENVEEVKEEKNEDTAVRKGEVAIIAEAPYSNEEDTSNKLSKAQLKKIKDKAWTKLMFGE